ncbi:MAG: hypothetical protein U0174_04730 [Polyangiaceae bacterium]
MRMSKSRHWFAGVGALALFGAAFSSTHCSTPEATGCQQLGKVIKVGEPVLCQCADRTGGEKTCQEDKTFTPCGPCPNKVACPDGKTAGEAVTCYCTDGTEAQQYCGDDGNLGECNPCLTSEGDGGTKKDGGACNNDGTPDPGETCDDGNSTETDDCTSNCLPTVKPSGNNACPGQPVDVWSEVTFQGTTIGLLKNHASNKICGAGSTNGGGSLDHIYAVTAHKGGVMDVKITKADFPHALYVRSDCGNAASEIVCANAHADKNDLESLVVPNVKSGTTYYVIVDGEANSAGTYTLNLRIR